MRFDTHDKRQHGQKPDNHTRRSNICDRHPLAYLIGMLRAPSTFPICRFYLVYSSFVFLIDIPFLSLFSVLSCLKQVMVFETMRDASGVRSWYDLVARFVEAMQRVLDLNVLVERKVPGNVIAPWTQVVLVFHNAPGVLGMFSRMPPPMRGVCQDVAGVDMTAIRNLHRTNRNQFSTLRTARGAVPAEGGYGVVSQAARVSIREALFRLYVPLKCRHFLRPSCALSTYRCGFFRLNTTHTTDNRQPNTAAEQRAWLTPAAHSTATLSSSSSTVISHGHVWQVFTLLYYCCGYLLSYDPRSIIPQQHTSLYASSRYCCV